MKTPRVEEALYEHIQNRILKLQQQQQEGMSVPDHVVQEKQIKTENDEAVKLIKSKIEASRSDIIRQNDKEI